MEPRVRSRTWKFVVNLFAFFVALEVIGLCGLVFLRLFVSHEVPIWSLLPYPAVSKVQNANEFTEFDPNLGWYPQTDMFGNRRRELPRKQPGEVRVFLLGGSTVWGIGATREDETIAKRLEVYLGSPQAKALLGGTVHVYNEGVPGYYSKQELILLITKIIPFEQPDLVVVLDGFNDFAVAATDRPRIDRIYSEVWHWNEAQLTRGIDRVMTPVGAFTNAVTWITVATMRSTFFGNFLDQAVLRTTKFGLFARLFAVKRPQGYRASVLISARDYYLENVAMMKSVCDGAKVRFFWFPQPVLPLKRQKTAEEEQRYKENANLWASLSDFYAATIKHEAVARFGKASFFHDISDSLESFQGTAYVDPFHYSPAAQDVIAKRMADAILEP